MIPYCQLYNFAIIDIFYCKLILVLQYVHISNFLTFSFCICIRSYILCELLFIYYVAILFHCLCIATSYLIINYVLHTFIIHTLHSFIFHILLSIMHYYIVLIYQSCFALIFLILVLYLFTIMCCTYFQFVYQPYML